jgi:hypothetical protein
MTDSANPVPSNRLPCFISGSWVEQEAGADGIRRGDVLFLYNYVTPHQTLTENARGRKTTPAMAAGVANHVWSYEDLLAMIDRLSEAENSN